MMGKYLYLITERQRRERERLEGMREKLLKDIKKALSELASIISFHEAYIFGSVVSSIFFSPDSDIDIGFYGLEDKDFFKAIAFLSRNLERDVDVIQLEGHRIEAKIKREGIQWKK